MRYAQGGGLTPREQQARQALRFSAADRFENGDPTADIARDLRISDRTVRRWRHDWKTGGTPALASTGPMSVEQLSPAQWARLEQALRRGPLAHGWDEGQGWTLVRVKTLIGRLFHTGYTVQGVWKLLRRHGWSAQVPARRALERDDASVTVWKDKVWPSVKRQPHTWAPTSASKTRPARG